MKRAVDGNDSQQQQQDVMPTLAQVAEEEDFAPLRELLKALAKRPVDQLLQESQEGAQLREIYVEKAKHANLEETWLSFVVACRAAAEQRKRARSGKGGDEGEREGFVWRIFCRQIFFFVWLLTLLAQWHPRTAQSSVSGCGVFLLHSVVSCSPGSCRAGPAFWKGQYS